MFEQFRSLDSINRAALTLALHDGKLHDINGIDLEQVRSLIETLRSPELAELVVKGEITVGLVRPQAFHNKEHLTDLQMEERIISEIKPPLKVMICFAIVFDKAMTDAFYGGEARDRQLKSLPYKHLELPSRWDEFEKIMTDGPTTVLIMHSTDGQAIPHWRGMVGHWDVEKTVQPGTIRGEYAVNNYNNLVHGSDRRESVMRELELIATQLEKTYGLTPTPTNPTGNLA